MNTTDRIFQLRLSLLRELNACGTHACPELALINAMYAAVIPPPTKIEVITECQWLANEDYIVVVNDSLGGSRKYRITDNGRLALHA